MPEKPLGEPHDMDEPVKLPLDPEQAIRGLAAVDPDGAGAAGRAAEGPRRRAGGPLLTRMGDPLIVREFTSSGKPPHDWRVEVTDDGWFLILRGGERCYAKSLEHVSMVAFASEGWDPPPPGFKAVRTTRADGSHIETLEPDPEPSKDQGDALDPSAESEPLDQCFAPTRGAARRRPVAASSAASPIKESLRTLPSDAVTMRMVAASRGQLPPIPQYDERLRSDYPPAHAPTGEVETQGERGRQAAPRQLPLCFRSPARASMRTRR